MIKGEMHLSLCSLQWSTISFAGKKEKYWKDLVHSEKELLGIKPMFEWGDILRIKKALDVRVIIKACPSSTTRFFKW